MPRNRKNSEDLFHVYKPAGKCHDCQKPSATYRCPACKAKFLAKYKKEGGDFGYGIPEDFYVTPGLRRNKKSTCL